MCFRIGRRGWRAGWAGIAIGGLVAMELAAWGEPLVPFSTIGRGALSQVHAASWTVARTQEEWIVLWRRHTGTTTAPPFVDFSSQMVVGIFAGRRPSAGYEIEITEVVSTDRAIRVRYRERSPGATALVAPVLTSPFHIIQLPRSDLPVDTMQQQ